MHMYQWSGTLRGMCETGHSITMTLLAEHGNDQSQEWFLLANRILSVISP